MVVIKHIVILLCLSSFIVIFTLICKPTLILWPQFQVELYQFGRNSSFFNFFTMPCPQPETNNKQRNVYDFVTRQKTIEYLEDVSKNFTHYTKPISFHTYFSSSSTSVCLIMKNGHSVIRFVNCLLKIKESGNETAYKEFDKLLTFKGAFESQCVHLAEKKPVNFKPTRRIAFIRDPFERFISGWLFLCKRNKICFDCGLDFGCFMETFYLCLTTNKTYSKICTYKSPSAESPFNKSDHIYLHMAPQVVYCNLLKLRHEYELIDYSMENVNNFLMTSAKSLLREDQFTNLQGRIQQKTIHAANEEDEEFVEALIQSNRTFATMFAELYYMDYKIFEFDIPQFIVDFKLYENDN